MAAELRYGATGALTGFGAGFGDGAGIFGSFRSGFGEAAEGWGAGRSTARGLPSFKARAWQGSGGYPGIDVFHDTVIPAGTQLEVLHPALTGFAVPEGAMAKLGLDSAEISRSVQVGPSDLQPGRILHEYRTEGVTIRFNADTPAATGVARANPQFGAGGGTQFFVPDLADHVGSGTVTVVDAGGSGRVLPMKSNWIADTGSGGGIPLTNYDLPPHSPILTNQQTANTAAGGATIVTGLGKGIVTGADSTAPTR
jgi:hypothetical protein